MRQERPDALRRGQALGRYIIVERVGRGGMGEVYCAHDVALDRTVAIKVLTCTMDDGSLRERITLREGQMLARVRHPNVVAVYDVGVSHGWPFIALEFVKGQQLSEWAAARPPSGPDLEAMMHRLAGGLQAIHDAGLIHRDIKPGNILVGDDGVPRLADLGVAKLLDDMTRDPDVTRTTIVGTHGFMAPEIADGIAATAASDVYSLCAAIAAVLPAAQKDPTARRLRALLDRGMSTDPDARPGASELEALTRPRPGRLRQLVVGLLGVLVGAGGISAWVYQSHERCKSPRGELDGVWGAEMKSEVRASILATEHPIADETSERVSRGLDDYAADWLSVYDRVCQSASGIRREQAIERTFRCLGRRRIELQALVDGLASIDPESVLLAVQAVAALEPPSACLEAGVEHDIDPERAESVLARLGSSHSKAQLGRYEEARELADGVLAAEAELTPSLRGEALFHRGQAELSLGWLERAQASLLEAYYAAVEARDTRLELWAAKALVNTHVTLERSDDARHWLRLAKLLAEQLDVPTWDLTYREGLLVDAEGDLAGAIELFRQALEQQGGHSRSQTHVMRNDLANVLLRSRQFSAAIEQLELAHASCVELLGEHHPHATAILAGMGMVYRELGRMEEAAEILTSTTALFEASVGPSHPFVAVSAGNLATVYADLGRFDDAIASYRRAVRVWSKLGAPSAPDVILAELGIADAHANAGRIAEALAILTALERDEADTLAESTSLHGHLEHQFAKVLLAQGDFDAALDRATSAAALAVEAHGAEHPFALETRTRKAEVLVALGRLAEARAILEPTLDAFTRASESGAEVAWARFTLARALHGSGHTEQALSIARAVVETFEGRDVVRARVVRDWIAQRQP